MVLAGIFAVGMMILLPKYAKFIHAQPKLHIEKMRRQEEEDNDAKKGQNPPQD